MKKYEYYSLSYHYGPREADLNTQGDLGWELVTMVRENVKDKVWYTAYFKREKQDEGR